MKFTVTFNERDPEFNQEYADEYHGGKESDGNGKYLWSKSYEVATPVSDYKVMQDKPLILEGENDDGSDFSFSISNVTIVECLTTDNKNVKFVVSNKLIDNTHVAYHQKSNTTRFYFYFKNEIEYVELSEKIFVVPEDIPKEWLTNN